MDTSVSDDYWGAQHHRVFHSGGILFEQFLIHTAV